jgi:transposase
MRKSFRGLVAVTEAVLQEDPTSGHLFVFVNRRRDMMKILHWDGAGFWIWYRQLERGTFQLPDQQTLDNASGIELTPSQLTLILDGIDLRSARQRLRHRELVETTE